MKRETGRLERPGCSIYYEATGEGPALVFAHGLGGNHMSWWQQVAYFSPRFRCITFAHRGFWPSSAIPDGPDPNDYAGDLAALVAHLGVESFVLVAQSMGGWTAVEYGLLGTGKVRGIVMAATSGSISREKLGELEALAAWEAASATTRAALREAGGHQATGLRMLAEQPAMALLYQHIDEANAGLPKEVLRARMNAMRLRAPEELAAAGCPILLIANEEDVVMPPFASAAIAARVPGARAAMIPKAGHSAYFERPATFNALVEEFLAGL
jgi:3-oxoadipate enol-lactonase